MPLTPDQMAEMSRLLDAARPLNEAGRRRWLGALAPEHRQLLPELRKALLSEYTELPPSASEDSGAPPATGLEPGAQVGPYELIRLLGAGGMAEVWLARRADGVLRREVALKLPLLTRVRRHFEQRFARERDILAGLEHPHIARLYDAGIDADGLPYLSMEYVQGRLLTDWCDGECLDIRQRLQLFLQVLEAVQYAHDRHVIHLDIKPSNILVSDTGQSRLLDFGVARLLENEEATGQTPLTKVYGHVITVVYASPEVLRGDPVDARSDIYSLGVVLFELLTGARPYRLQAGASRGVLEQAIATVEVQRPSTQLAEDAGMVRSATHEQLVRQLRGDLDLIVLKALAKDPEARYASARALADDIRAYLGGKPIAAKPPRLGYRLEKFILRNRAAVIMTTVAAIVLCAMAAYEIERRADERTHIALVAALNSIYPRRPVSDKSIAVLPFLDMSEKHDQSYFSDGLTEEMINLLAQIPDLQVIARTSSFHFQGKQVPIAEIGAILGVANVLEGSVRRSGTTVRVTAQLIRADSGVHLWSQTYDRDVKDIFELQDEIADAVVAALKLKLLASPVVDLHRSDNPEAYNDYLLGRQLGRRGNLKDYERAIAAYRRAIELDPGYAAAYAGLSFNETALANYNQDRTGFARANEAAEKALALAPQLADAYRARAGYRLEMLDFAGARADGERALTLAPGDSAVQSLYGVQIAAFGKIRQAITAMGKAVELDPLNSYAWGNMGLFLTMDRDYPAARRALNRALAISPDSDALHFALGQLDMLEGRFPDAMAEFAKEGNAGARRMSDALLEHARGDEPKSEQALNDLIAAHAGDMAYQVGDVYAWRGDKDKAFEWLERAYQQRDSGLNGIAYDPLLAGLAGDPRRDKLLKELALAN